MAVQSWFSRRREEELPEEIRGKDPEAIANELKKLRADAATAADLQTELNKLKTEAGSRSDYDEIKKRLGELEANRQQVTTPQRREADQQHGPTSFVEDEDRAFAERAAPIAQVAIQSGALSAKQEARNILMAKGAKPGEVSDYRLFVRYESEIDKILENEAPQHRVNPKSWLNAFAYVKGTHMDDIIKGMREGDTSLFSETGSSGGGPRPGDNDLEDKTKDTLTEQEKKIAKSFKISEADYLKQKKGMVIDTTASI